MLLSLSLLAGLVITGINAIPHPSPHAVHVKRTTSSRSWTLSRRAHPDHPLPMRIGLKQSNIDRLHDELMAISDPESEHYGKHWSPQRVADFFRPSKETSEAVRTWLIESGFESGRIKVANGGHWMQVNTTVSEIEELLRTEYHVYEHASGKQHTACNSYSIPVHLQPHIELITPTTDFDALVPPPKREESLLKRAGSKTLAGLGNPGSNLFNGPKTGPEGLSGLKTAITELEQCDTFITPICLQALYEVAYRPIQTNKNSYGIVEYTPQAFLPSDLDMFFKNFSKGLVGQRPTFVSIDGGVAQQTNQSFNFNGESDLDLEYAMTLVAPQKVTLYQAGDLPQGASFNNLLDALDASYCTFEGGDDPNNDGIYPDPLPGGFDQPESCGIVKPANVISTSYGFNEADASFFYTNRQCNEYGKLGLLGVTFLYSSGDFGVAGFGGECLNPDGSQSTTGVRFNPGFPATCPFVTAVGATQVNPNSTVFQPESACEQVIFSGGGFSNFFETPSYQKTAVANWFKNFPPPYTSAQFNNSMTSRGFPDVAANGANYVIAIDGSFNLVFGTSASSPTFGSILTLINDARITFGKKPIGFINPAIYSARFAHSFNDITSGGNQGCGTPGFTSVRGWDPVTGLGTPNFPKLLASWLSLP